MRSLFAFAALAASAVAQDFFRTAVLRDLQPLHTENTIVTVSVGIACCLLGVWRAVDRAAAAASAACPSAAARLPARCAIFSF